MSTCAVQGGSPLAKRRVLFGKRLDLVAEFADNLCLYNDLLAFLAVARRMISMSFKSRTRYSSISGGVAPMLVSQYQERCRPHVNRRRRA